LRRDGAVLVAHIGVLLLLEGVHGLDLVHGLFITDAQCVRGWRSLDKVYLETLLEKVPRRTFRAHRPRNIVAGTRIQPTDDTVEEEGDGEESDEDLDDI
jgi:hypothetical protein